MVRRQSFSIHYLYSWVCYCCLFYYSCAGSNNQRHLVAVATTTTATKKYRGSSTATTRNNDTSQQLPVATVQGVEMSMMTRTLKNEKNKWKHTASSSSPTSSPSESLSVLTEWRKTKPVASPTAAPSTPPLSSPISSPSMEPSSSPIITKEETTTTASSISKPSSSPIMTIDETTTAAPSMSITQQSILKPDISTNPTMIVPTTTISSTSPPTSTTTTAPTTINNVDLPLDGDDGNEATDTTRAELLPFSLVIDRAMEDEDDELYIRKQIQYYLLDSFNHRLLPEFIDSIQLDIVSDTLRAVTGNKEEEEQPTNRRNLQFEQPQPQQQPLVSSQASSSTSTADTTTSTTVLAYIGRAIVKWSPQGEPEESGTVVNVDGSGNSSSSSRSSTNNNNSIAAEITMIQEIQITSLEATVELQEHFLKWFALQHLVSAGDEERETTTYPPVVLIEVQVDDRAPTSVDAKKTWQTIDSILNNDSNDPTTDSSSSNSANENQNDYAIGDGNEREIDDEINNNNNNNNTQQNTPQTASQLNGALAIGNNNNSCTDDEQGFEDQVEITRDTGSFPLLVVILFGIFSQFLLLPLLIVCCRRRRRKKRLRRDEQAAAAAAATTSLAVVMTAPTTANNNNEESEHNNYAPNGMEMAYFEDTAIFDAALHHHRHHRRDPATTQYRIAEEARMSTLRRVEEGEESEEEIQFYHADDNSQPPPPPPPHSYYTDDISYSYDAANDTESVDVQPVLLPPPPDDTEKRTTTRGRRHSTFLRFFGLDSCHHLVSLFRYDHETKRILRLSIPFTLSELIAAIAEVIVLGIVSYQLGTGALSAFAVTETLIEITTEFAMGVVDAQSSLTGHAYGAKNNVMAGQYAQLCPMVYVLFQLPFILIWSFATYDIMLWMDFSPCVATMAQDYGRLVVWRDVVVGVSGSLSAMFEVADKEIAIALIGNMAAIVELAVIAIALIVCDGDLVTVGTIAIVNALFFYVFTIVLTYWKGWMTPFAKGMFGSLAWKNRLVVKQVFKTATPLAFGAVLMHGEWEVLTVFAAYLGPAEVTAWAILGSVWDIFESSSEGIGDAAEVRVAYNLGKRRSDQARISAYKSNVIGILFSIVISVIFLALGNQIPHWLTRDVTLQRMIGDNIPLLCIGNIIMTAGSVCWAEIGAQGRYKLATIIFFVSSWFVTIPLAAISVYCLHLDLRGVTASVCIGFLCACTALAYVVLQSDWERLAQKVADLNAVAAVAGQRSKNMLDQHEEDDWKELPIWIREAASVLGYTKKLWDNDMEPSTCNKDWNKLSLPELEACTKLGYNAEMWNNDSDSDSDSDDSSSSSSSSSAC